MGPGTYRANPDAYIAFSSVLSPKRYRSVETTILLGCRATSHQLDLIVQSSRTTVRMTWTGTHGE